MSSRPWLAGVVVPAVLLSGACGGAVETAVTPGVSGDAIFVGALTPLSDPVAVIGRPMLRGQQLYFDRLNAAGGIGGRYQVKILEEDITYANPSTSVQKYQKLKDQVAAFTMVLGTELNGQNYDGGWGWWPASESDPFMTAYILFGLNRARSAGVEIPDSNIDQAVNYLKTSLSGMAPADEPWEFDRLAFIHYALAISNAGEVENMLSLYQSRDRLNPWGKALLALGLETSSPGSEESQNLLADLESSAARTAAGAHWELSDKSWQNLMSTHTNSAIVTYALAQRDPASPLIADATRYLMANRQADGGWTSSYTTAWTLMALTQVMKGTTELGGDFEFGALLNGSSFASGKAGGPDQLTPVTTNLPLGSLYPDAPNDLTFQRNACFNGGSCDFWALYKKETSTSVKFQPRFTKTGIYHPDLKMRGKIR